MADEDDEFEVSVSKALIVAGAETVTFRRSNLESHLDLGKVGGAAIARMTRIATSEKGSTNILRDCGVGGGRDRTRKR